MFSSSTHYTSKSGMTMSFGLRRGTSIWHDELSALPRVGLPYPAAAIATAAMDNDNAMDIDAAVNDTAMNDATIDEAATAIDQGGTVFLFMVSSCFYSKSFSFILFFPSGVCCLNCVVKLLISNLFDSFLFVSIVHLCP